jgi:phosphatidate cytidylyltransferase
VLKTRLITAFFLIPLILGSVYYGGLVFFALIAALLLIAGYELFEMARHAGHPPMPWLGLALIALILLDAYTQSDFARAILAGALVVSLTVGVVRPREGWLAGWAITVAGALYVGWLGAYFLFVRALPNGLMWTTLALVTAWATDTGAYIAGTCFGRHKFFPRISPKKTWEGAIGGMIAALLAMFALGWLLSLPIVHSAILGLIIGIAATFCDLAESLLKRQTGVKDSSNLVPGHGGMLDRIDSLLFTAVVVYYYLVWILRVTN